jgi:hypothetical protein
VSEPQLPASPAGHPEQYLLTPRLRGGERLNLRVSETDYRKIKRGKHWRAVVTDLPTGKQYLVCSASCGIPSCRCDAIAKEKP